VSESLVCTLTADGELIEQRIVTSRTRFTAVLGGRPAARILLEAAMESEWVARHLESLGHAVVVANPSFAPMYATRSSRVKTDKRDARTRYVAIIKAFVRREGLRLASGEPERTAVKLAQLDHSPSPVSVRRSQSRGPVAWMADIATSLAAFAERGVVSLCR